MRLLLTAKGIWMLPQKALWAALFIKTALFIFFAAELHKLPLERCGPLLRLYDDSRSYIQPALLLAEGKGYSRDGFPEFVEPETLPFAGRLPGFALPFAALHVLLGEKNACTAWVLMQFLLSLCCVPLMGWMALQFWPHKSAAAWAMLLYALSYQLHIYDHAALTESVCISLICISTALLLRYRKCPHPKLLFWAGLTITGAVFFRPIAGVFMPIWAGMAWAGTASPAAGIRRLIYLALPLGLALTLWIGRNAFVTGRFIPLEDAWIHSYPHEPEYSKSGMAIRSLIRLWGEDMLKWTPGTAGYYLMNPEVDKALRQVLPPKVSVQGCTFDTLHAMKQHYLAFSRSAPLDSARKLHDATAARQAEACKTAFRRAHPRYALIGSRLRLSYLFIFRPMRPDFGYPPRQRLNTRQFWVKSGWTLFHAGILLISPVGFVLLLFKQKNPYRWLLPAFPLAMLLVLCWGLGMIEDRYILPAYPFMLLAVSGLAAPTKKPATEAGSA